MSLGLLGLTPDDIRLAVSRATRTAIQHNWVVLDPISTTQFTVGLKSPGVGTPYLTQSALNLYTGATLEFVTGILGGMTQDSTGDASVYGRVTTQIGALSSTLNTNSAPTTTLTTADALPAKPSKGDEFVIFYPLLGMVTVPGSQVSAVGTSVAALSALLSPSFTVPVDGMMIASGAMNASATTAGVRWSLNDGSNYYDPSYGLTYTAGQTFTAPTIVPKGAEINFSMSAATTLDFLYVFYLSGI